MHAFKLLLGLEELVFGKLVSNVHGIHPSGYGCYCTLTVLLETTCAFAAVKTQVQSAV